MIICQTLCVWGIHYRFLQINLWLFVLGSGAVGFEGCGGGGGVVTEHGGCGWWLGGGRYDRCAGNSGHCRLCLTGLIWLHCSLILTSCSFVFYGLCGYCLCFDVLIFISLIVLLWLMYGSYIVDISFLYR